MAKVKHIPTQNDRIIEYLKEHGSITHLSAEQHLGICRLASRISDLKRMGFVFETEWKEVQNRYGEKTRVKSYRFAEEV